MKPIVSILSILILAACSGGGGGGNNNETTFTTETMKEVTDTSTCKGPATYNSAVGHSWAGKYESKSTKVEHIISIDSENQVTVKAACDNGLTAIASSKAVVTSDKIQILEKTGKLETASEKRGCEVKIDPMTISFKLVGQCLAISSGSLEKLLVHKETLAAPTPVPDATPVVETPPPSVTPQMDFANSPYKGQWQIKTAKCGNSNSRTLREFTAAEKSKSWTFGPEGEFWEITMGNENCDRLSLIGKYTYEEDAIKSKFDTVSFVPGCPSVPPAMEERKVKLEIEGNTMKATLESGPSFGFCKSGTETLTLEKK